VVDCVARLLHAFSDEVGDQLVVFDEQYFHSLTPLGQTRDYAGRG
jgi:hypothetical protein